MRAARVVSGMTFIDNKVAPLIRHLRHQPCPIASRFAPTAKTHTDNCIHTHFPNFMTQSVFDGRIKNLLVGIIGQIWNKYQKYSAIVLLLLFVLKESVHRMTLLAM